MTIGQRDAGVGVDAVVTRGAGWFLWAVL